MSHGELNWGSRYRRTRREGSSRGPHLHLTSLPPVHLAHATNDRELTFDYKPTFYRATIVADPSPPPQQVSGAASLPGISQPVVGTGDAATLKDAEKLAALHACLQLSARGLFTESNLPTRTKGMRTPLHAASQSANGGGGGGGGSAFPVFAPTTNGKPAGNDGKTVGLSGGQRIGLEEARAFMDYYCALIPLPRSRVYR